MKRKTPSWIPLFYDEIYRHWEHHGPCENINLSTKWLKKEKMWSIIASPVYQEILGGEDDGKQIWTGFLFDVGQFGRAEGVWIQEFAIKSVCELCSSIPNMVIKGKFKGRNFFLKILLEPITDSDTIEVIDTLSNEVRKKSIIVDDELN